MPRYTDEQRALIDDAIEDNNESMDASEYEEQETSESIEEARRNRHKEQLDYDEMLADQAEAAEDGLETNEYEVDEPEDKPEVRQTDTKHRIKVNGKEFELTTDELIARASKVEAADEYLRAAKATHDANKNNYQPSQDVDNKVEDEFDELAIVRAIQMGDEEEAVAAIRKLRQGPSVKSDDIGKIVDERVAFQKAAEYFQSEYEDIVGDPFLQQMAVQEDARLMQNGFTGSYEERFAAAGNTVRAWRDNFVQSQTKTQSNSMSEKQQKKIAVPQVPASQQRASKQVQQDLDEEDYDAAYIRKQMANQRRY